jgi:hypothetical protein
MEKRTKNVKFAVFCNQAVGTWKPAKDFDDLLNKMTKKQREFWSNIQFIDSQGRLINITREFLEEGMTFDEAVWDWLEWADINQLEEKIHAI